MNDAEFARRYYAAWNARDLEAIMALYADDIEFSSPYITALGFSMGGVIARAWIQLLSGHRRTRRLISVGSPQQGTLTAGPWPRWPLAGVADLKWGSPLLERLNRDLEPLERIECCSFYSGLDLMVVPGWRAVLPVGPRHMLPVWTHPQLLRQAAALDPLVRELLRA